MVREAQEADVPRLAEILRLSPEAGSWEESDLRASITSDPARQCFVAARGERVLGFLLAARPVREEAEILTLAVDPATRRQGVGTSLLKALLQGRPGRVFLEVRRSNLPAQRFYGSLGFITSGIRPGYYRSPEEDAVLMQLLYSQSF